MEYQCHVNRELVSSKGRVIKYLYKYLLKGPDYVSFQIVSKSSKDKSEAKHQSESKDDGDANWSR